MVRKLALLVLATAVLWACGESSTGGGGGTAVPTMEPWGGTFEPTTPVRPSAWPSAEASPSDPRPSADPNVARRLVLASSGVFRAGFPASAEELAAIGWTIHVGAGRAQFWDPAIGREDINWSVPEATIPTDAFDNLWLNGEVTSRAESNLNLQIGLGATGFAIKQGTIDFAPGSFYEEKAAFSQGGKPESMAEIRTTVRARSNAVPGEEAQVKINLGWQSQGYEVIYRYTYQP